MKTTYVIYINCRKHHTYDNKTDAMHAFDDIVAKRKDSCVELVEFVPGQIESTIEMHEAEEWE